MLIHLPFGVLAPPRILHHIAGAVYPMRQRRLGSSRYQDRGYAVLISVLAISLGFAFWNYSNTIFGLLSSSSLQNDVRKKSSSFSIYRNNSLHINICGQHMNMDNSSLGLDDFDCSGVPWPKTPGVRPRAPFYNSDHKLVSSMHTIYGGFLLIVVSFFSTSCSQT